MVLGTGLALPMFVPGSALGADGKVAPSDRLGIGFIGLGRQAVHANMSVFLRSGYRCRARWGQLAADLYSVQHIARLLGDKYPALSFAELDKWLRTVVRDEELAQVRDFGRRIFDFWPAVGRKSLIHGATIVQRRCSEDLLC